MLVGRKEGEIEQMTPKEAFKVLKNTLAAIKVTHVQYSKALHLAMAALQKQIPQKPIPERSKYTGNILYHRCPNCNNSNVGEEYQSDYCDECGQALDWSDT